MSKWILFAMVICNIITVSHLRQVCAPKAGKTGIIIGQDFYSIANYTASFSSYQGSIGYMSYTGFSESDGNDEMTGLRFPIDYGSGLEWAWGLVNFSPQVSLQLGLYLVGDLKNISQGKRDKELDALICFLVEDLSSTLVYLRIGYEFDFPSNDYDPDEYIEAFKYIVNRLRNHATNHGISNVTRMIQKNDNHNVQMVWHSGGFRQFMDEAGKPTLGIRTHTRTHARTLALTFTLALTLVHTSIMSRVSLDGETYFGSKKNRLLLTQQQR